MVCINYSTILLQMEQLRPEESEEPAQWYEGSGGSFEEKRDQGHSDVDLCLQ